MTVVDLRSLPTYLEGVRQRAARRRYGALAAYIRAQCERPCGRCTRDHADAVTRDGQRYMYRRHGTRHGYREGRCACECCLEADREYRHARRERVGPEVSGKTRRAILERFPFCYLCGAPATSIDHVDPRGGNDVRNLAPCCPSCNASKGDRSLDAYAEWLAVELVAARTPNGNGKGGPCRERLRGLLSKHWREVEVVPARTVDLMRWRSWN